MAELDFTQLARLITVKDVAEHFEVEDRIVRREVRKTPCPIPGAVKILGKWGFDPDLVLEWTPPEGGGERASKREDGRTQYRIFLSKEELATLSPTYEIVDPRIAAKARRAARKAKAAAAAAGEGGDAVAVAGDTENPFNDFGVGDEPAVSESG